MHAQWWLRLRWYRTPQLTTELMRPFKCKCGNLLFFDNSLCLQCGNSVGYDPDKREMSIVAPKGKVAYCANGVTHNACNWLVKPTPAKGGVVPPPLLCKSCQLTQTIPDLSDPNNLVLWAKTEAAKRRLLVTFDLLGIKLIPKSVDPVRGIAFDLISHKTSPQLMMGHMNGVITVHVDEADDTEREITRNNLNEPVRTLLGHFRHESGHYAWERWQNALPPEDPQRLAFREIFGDERQVEYSAAIAKHYQAGPPADWQSHYISAYASSHPWEDWAETWGFYLQIVDGLETVDAMGLQQGRKTPYVKPFPPEAGTLPSMLPQKRRYDTAFLDWLNRWVTFSTVLNELSKSLGHAPLHPFVLSIPVARKLRLIHWLVEEFRNKN